MRKRWVALWALACACSQGGEAAPEEARAGGGAPLSAILPGDSRALAADGESSDPLADPVGGVGGAAPGHVGVVVARETVDVAARHVGEVAEVLVRIGDEVGAGDPIARLDEDSIREARAVIRAELGAARAELSQARVDLQEARERLERRQELQTTVSGEDLEAAQFAVDRAKAVRDRARADVNRQQAKLREIDRQLGEASITAPLPGTVATRFVDPGTLVEPGEPIVRLIASEGAWIRFAVPPEAAARLALDSEVEAQLESSDQALPAIIRQIAPQIDPESRMVLVEAELRVPEDAGLHIYSGLPVRVRVGPPADAAEPAHDAPEPARDTGDAAPDTRDAAPATHDAAPATHDD